STDPLGSDTKAGQTTYEDLYADPLLWMKEGWLDYIVPQAYWSMDYPAASHRKITEWWAHNSVNAQLYMGNGAYKVKNNADNAWDKKQELPQQLKLARSIPKVKGNVFFSAKSLPQHSDVSKKIQRKFYAFPANVPSSKQNIYRSIPEPVIVFNEMVSGKRNICISHYDSVPLFLSVYKSNSNKKRLPKLLKKVYLPANESLHCFELKNPSRKVELLVKDAFGNESQPIPSTN
ncbi:MAG: family 10 glycosylhydrolase, partial [Bacteroidota bacterium]